MKARILDTVLVKSRYTVENFMLDDQLELNGDLTIFFNESSNEYIYELDGIEGNILADGEVVGSFTPSASDEKAFMEHAISLWEAVDSKKFL